MGASLTPVEIALYPESQQHLLVALLVLFLAIGNSSVIWRLYSQWSISRRLFAEDYCIILALIFTDIVNACYLAAVTNGFGLHLWRVIQEQPYGGVVIFQTFWLSGVFSGPFFFSLRLSLLFFYRRIFVVNQDWIKIAWKASFVYNALWFVGSTTFYIVQCQPPSYYWTRFYARFGLPQGIGVSGSCSVATRINVSMPLILGLVADIAILFMPLLSLAKLRLTVKRKLGLLVLFLFGFLACLLELARIVVLNVDTDATEDPTYGTVFFTILTCSVESIAVMCACVPHIFSHVRQWRKQRHPTSSSKGWSELSNMPQHARDRQSRVASAKALEFGQSARSLETGTQTMVSATNDPDDDSSCDDSHNIRVRTDVEMKVS